MEEEIENDETFIEKMRKEIEKGEEENAINLIRIYLRDIRDLTEETDYHIETFFEEKLKLLMQIKNETLSNKIAKSAKYFCEDLCKEVCIKMMKTAYKYSDKECIEMYKFISYYYKYSLDDNILITEKEKEFLNNINRFTPS